MPGLPDTDRTDAEASDSGDGPPRLRSVGRGANSPVLGRRLWRDAFRTAALAWLVAHAVILVIQDIAQRRDPPYPAAIPNQPPIHHLFNELYTWDTAWYAGIAGHGYSGVPNDGIRFWPLYPLSIRVLDLVGIGPETGALVVAWIAALLFGVLMYRLAVTVGADRGTARRAVWLSQLAPGAFVLVMGYTEALAGMLAAAFLIAIRQAVPRREPRRQSHADGPGTDASDEQIRRIRRSWIWLGVGFIAGFCSGLVRPTGWLLAIPGAIEAVRQYREGPRRTLARVAVAISPLLGVGVFLVWASGFSGDWILPFSIQQRIGLRGTIAQNPLPSVLDSLNQVGNGAGAFTVILLVVSLGLFGACIRRMPISYTVWTAVSLLSVITAPHLSSFARYASGFLPLLLVAAMLTSDRKAWRWTICTSAAFAAYFAFQSFIGVYIP